MKLLPLCAAIAGCAGIFGISETAHALDVTQSIPLERYTIISDDTLKYDVGRMNSSGKFITITSTDMGLLGFSIDDFEAISGKPIMVEEAFDDYKAAGVIPHWVRSREDFALGLETYVIVSVAGGPNPNPTPVIEEQPTNQTVLEGRVSLFAVTASPAAYLSYQWLFNGKPIPGQTLSFLILDVEEPSQGGNYSVELNAGGKNIVSKKAALKVIVPVAIPTGPKSQTVKEGHGAVFRVATKGSGPFTYQWYFNDSPLPKATKSFYTLQKTTTADAGSYGVVVSNKLSSAQSQNAVLTVNP